MAPLNLKCRAKAKNYKNAKVTPGAKVAPVDGTAVEKNFLYKPC